MADCTQCNARMLQAKRIVNLEIRIADLVAENEKLKSEIDRLSKTLRRVAS